MKVGAHPTRRPVYVPNVTAHNDIHPYCYHLLLTGGSSPNSANASAMPLGLLNLELKKPFHFIKLVTLSVSLY